MTTAPDGRTRKAKIGDAVYDAFHQRVDGSSLIPVARAEVVQDVEALIAAGEITPSFPQRAGNLALKAFGVKKYELGPNPRRVANAALSRLVKLGRIDIDENEGRTRQHDTEEDITFRLHEGDLAYGEWPTISR